MQRSRRRLAANQRCYLCAEPIESHQNWDRDHVPPRRIYGARIKRTIAPQLRWLPTHTHCNASYRADEEYVITALAPAALTHDRHAVPTPAAGSVIEDIIEARLKGHGTGLLRSTLRNWGTVLGPNKEVVFEIDWHRFDRVAWKVVRGIYCLDTGRVLEPAWPCRIELFSSVMVPKALANPAIRAVLTTHSMSHAGHVFDYKWGCFVGPGDFRGHLILMLWWDSLLISVGFKEPQGDAVRR